LLSLSWRVSSVGNLKNKAHGGARERAAQGFNKRNQRVSAARLGACNVAAIVKAGASKLGLEAAAGHSLRAGFVTSAVKRGANLLKITDVTGHRSLEMLKTYSRDAEAFVGHAGAGLL
jgi:site-specific recombinase XerD